MPELPDISAHIAALEARVLGQRAPAYICAPGFTVNPRVISGGSGFSSK